MNRMLSWMLCAALLLTGCAAPAQSDESDVSPLIITAWVDEVSENHIMITTVDYDGFDRASVNLDGADLSFEPIAGQKIQLELEPEIQETYPVQVKAAAGTVLEEFDPLRPALNLLATITEEGEVPETTGCFAVSNGKVIKGQDVADRFYACVDEGTPARMLFQEMTVEGDPLYTALCYDGKTIRGVADTSWDAFGATPSQRSFEYSFIKQHEDQAGDTYVYLQNQADLKLGDLIENQWNNTLEQLGAQFFYSLYE